MSPRVPLAALAVALALASPAMAERRVNVLIDTSGSMIRMDAPKYAVQLAKILADLTEAGDHYHVTRLPPSPSEVDICSTPPTPALRLAMRQGDYAGFKGAIDGFIGRYTGGNKFAASIHTALEMLTLDPSHDRLLLFLADSGGLSNECDVSLTNTLKRFRDSGGMVAAVNIGSTTGGFGSNPAFHFSRAARNSGELIDAVAEVYQRFLGSRGAKTGRLKGGAIEVEIGSYVREAFLVAAADGDFAALTPGPSNPSSKAVDLNLRGGGSTIGLDGKRRDYRIARLTQPQGGRWRFQAGSAEGGWMLIEESAIAVRPLEAFTAGPSALIAFEVYDERTGRRIVGADLPSLQVDLEISGQRLTLRDDGANGDEKAGDGILSARANLPSAGSRTASAVLRGGDLERRLSLRLDIREPGWRIEPQIPAKVDLGEPVTLRARASLRGGGASSTGAPPYLEARLPDGTPIRLAHDGAGGYSAQWTPERSGEMALRLELPPGVAGDGVDFRVEALGRLSASGPLPAVTLRPVRSGEEALGTLDLSGVEVLGEVRARASTTLRLSNAPLLMQTDEGWTPLRDEPVLRLGPAGVRNIPLRLAAESCPTACSPSQPHEIVLRAERADGSVVELRAPLRAEVIDDPFWDCYWQYFAAALATMLGGVVVYGFSSPSRFNPRDGVQLSQEADLEEGFFHRFRSQPGSRAGFYRDARLYLSSDFQVSGAKRAALVRLRADRGRVMIQPGVGHTLWRENLLGEWEELPPEETPARTGVVYRSDDKSLYFELRTGG